MKTATLIHTLTLSFVIGMALSAGAATVGTFTGGDVGEGLDLQGHFVYAIDTGSEGTSVAGPDRPIDEAVFRDNFAGVNLIPGTAPWWGALTNWGTTPNFGASANDVQLNAVLHDIGVNQGRLSNSFEVVPGQTYKLQLILSENHYNGSGQTREQDVVIYDGTYNDDTGTGRTVFDTVSNLNVTSETGGWSGAPDEGVVVTSAFTALSNWVTLSTHAPATPSGGLDTTAIMNATTLEATPNPGVMRIIHNASELDTSPALYAVNVSNDSPDRTVGGLTFQSTDGIDGGGDDVPGVTVSSNAAAFPWGAAPNLGATADDDQLEQIMHDIRYGNFGDVNIDATVGTGRIEITLLFSENAFTTAGARSFDVEIEGVTVVDELDVFAAAGGQSRVLALTYETFVLDGNLDIDLLQGSSFADGNPIIAGFTVRSIPSPAALPAGLALLLGVSLTRRSVGRRRG